MNKSALLPIENRIYKHLEEHFSNASSPSFVLGVSGGPDSMALLYIFRKLEVNAVVVHVNYQKRGEESDKDEELVREMAHQWEFDCHCIRLDPPDEEGINFQQWARDRRYRIFEDLATECKAEGIAVAHNRDDQIETILQKLFRGAGLESWSGMSIWENSVFRPLLDTGREEIARYIEQEAVPYRTDRSNLESDFARNLLRNEWLEKLEKYFPGWRENILRLPGQADTFGKALEFIEKKITGKRDRIELPTFAELDPSLQKALVLHLLKKRDPAVEISTGSLNRVERLSGLQPGKNIQLNDEYSLLVGREWIKIVYEPPEPLELVTMEEQQLREKSFSFDGLEFRIQPLDSPDYERALFLDVSKIDWPLTLRRWKAGDLFQPFGMSGHQNVSDHLTNRKVSSTEKGRALVLESFEETLCAVIFPPIEKMTPPGTISEQVRCDDETTECLVIDWKNNS